jgi:uncharacterized protein YdhG (YjbR/CyaY superfamily)
MNDIDRYLALQPAAVRTVLEKLRRTIRATAPDAEEVMSYHMPAYKFHGMLVGFAAWKNHCGFYPWNSSTVKLFRDELKDFSCSKGAIQFTVAHPLPVALVKRILRARMKENVSRTKGKHNASTRAR